MELFSSLLCQEPWKSLLHSNKGKVPNLPLSISKKNYLFLFHFPLISSIFVLVKKILYKSKLIDRRSWYDMLYYEIIISIIKIISKMMTIYEFDFMKFEAGRAVQSLR